MVLWCHPDRFDPTRGPLRAFLLSVARHRAIDVLRREYAQEARAARAHTAPPPPSTPEDGLLGASDVARVRTAIERLPAAEREAILVAFYGGCSYREAAARLGEPEGTVKSRIRSGLRRLRPDCAELDGVGRSGGGVGPPVADGAVWEAPARWFAAPSPAEAAVLEAATGPVLDIGCGPGRHLLALGAAGVDAAGIDASPVMVALARRRGATAFQGSIFDAVPGAGRWGSCLLMDGNLGIGGRPRTLLAQTRRLLRPGGRVLVEAGPPGTASRRRTVRLGVAGTVGSPFPWVDVGLDRVSSLADAVGLTVTRTWSADHRWFAALTG